MSWPSCNSSAVVATHARIDHSGWLPGLTRDAITGPVFATTSTCDPCKILLPDAAHLQAEQARFANERWFSTHHPAEPLYTSQGAADAIALLHGVGFDTPPIRLGFEGAERTHGAMTKGPAPRAAGRLE